MNRFIPILVAALVIISMSCSGDDQAWRKARGEDTVQSYAAYHKAYPEGKHISEAAQRTEYLGQKEIVDRIFKNLESTYEAIFKLNDIPYTIQEKIAEPQEEPSAAPSPAAAFNIPPPLPPPPPPPTAKGAKPISVKRQKAIGIPGFVLTAGPNGTYRIYKNQLDPLQLEGKLKEIYEAKLDKTIFFRFLRPVKNYEEVIDLVVLLKRAGVENPIPIITPQIKDIVWEEFKGTIDIPILKEDTYAKDDGIDPDKVLEEDFSDYGVEGGVVGGVPGGVVGGVLGGAVGEVEAPVRAGGEVKQPKLLKEVPPIYPEIARQARVEGVVIVEVTTDIYGRVAAWRVLRSIPLLDQAAVDAVRQWVYEPTVISGKPRSVIFNVTVVFKLPE